MKSWSSCLVLYIVASVLLLKDQLSLGQQQQQLQFLGEQPFRAYASRSTTLGQVLYRLFVNSISDEAHGITYSISQATDPTSSRHFMLSAETGELQLVLLFSSLAEHVLVIEAQSAASNVVAIQAHLSVVVVAESELVSRFERESYNLSVSEDYRVEQPFSVIRAFPLSPVSTNSYSVIGDTSAGRFSIDGTNGLFSIAHSLDREEVDRYFLTIRYSFNSRFIDADVTVSVLDANDNSPHFGEMIYNITVAEDSALSTSVLTVSAVDPDIESNGVIRYSLDPVAATDFSLDSETGVLSVSSELDYERVDHYQFMVTAVDGGSPPASSEVTVLVNIGNVDDECPRFDNPLYVANIDASQLTPNLLVLTVRARDPDGLGIDRITYAIVSSSVSGDALSLNQMTGDITITNATHGQYSVNISASDDACVMNSFSWVEIRILDTNNHSPMFVTPCNATLPENPPLGTAVMTLAATDADMGVNGEIVYSLLNTSLFSIDSVSGIVTTNQIPSSYDREAQEVFQVGVIASDSGLRQDYCLLTIMLLDENDNAPVFVLPIYNITLSLDTPSFSPVAMMIAFDSDTGANGNLVYSLSEPNQGNFSIDVITAEMSTTGPNSLGGYSLSVTAMDMGEPASRSSSVSINIRVVSGNASPAFHQLYYNTTLCENVPVGKPVLTLSASGTPNPTYMLSMGNDYSTNSENAFVLSDSTLRVGSSVLVDYERLNSRGSFVFAVIASNEAGLSFAIVEIFVADLDDNSPMVDSGYSFSLVENQPSGLIVTQILAHDPDSGTNGEIAYRLTGGSSSAFFQVSSTGVVTSNHTFDFENITELHSGELSIELYNPNPSSSNISAIRDTCNFEVFLDSTLRTVSVRWNVLDQNDNPPEFRQSTYVVRVSEDQHIWTAIFNLTATDLDVSDLVRLSFIIVEGNDGTFVVDGNSLVLLRRLNYEMRSNYNLTVQVTDGIHSRRSCSQCTAVIMVIVLDVDDEPPAFSLLTYTGRVVEMAALGTPVLTLAAQDADSVSTSYRLTGPALGRFDVLSSGEVVVSGVIDREEFPGGIIYFLVIAESGGIATAEVNVTVLDINDHAPRFLDMFSGRILENTVPGEEGIFIVQVTAQDPDEARNGTVTYTLRIGTMSGFRINSNTGIITAHAEYDREMQSLHFLVIEAMDDGIPTRLSSTTLVVVEVGDENDNPPFFPFPFMFARLFESDPIGSHILNIPVYDLDEGANANLIFSLISSTLPDKFSLNPSTGEVLLAGNLDYEIPQHRKATLTIGIQDSQFPGEAATGVLCISLLDRNDNAPQVNPPVYNVLLGNTLTISETFPIGQTLATITAVDEDEGSNGELDFSIISGDNGGDFRISSTGSVTHTRQLDYETTSRYSLLVSVSDRGIPPQSTEVMLEFNIQDINDNPPSFSQSTYRVSVQENEPPVDSILRVSATDPDTDIGGLIGSYQIISGNTKDRFTLNSTTGVLRTNAPFDREEIELYTLTITANDQGAESMTGTGTIQIIITDVNDNPSQMGGVMSVFIYDGGGLTRRMRIGTVYFQDPDTTSNSFQSCIILEPFSFSDLFAVDSADCMLRLGDRIPGSGQYNMTVVGRDGAFTSVRTNVTITVQRIDNTTLSEEGAVTLTLNASAQEYHTQGLNAVLMPLLAQHLGVQVQPLSLQTGYHDPNTVDLTFSATRAAGNLMSPTEVINRLFLSREDLFVGRHGVIAIPADTCVAEPCFNQAKCRTTRTIGSTQPAASSNQYALLAPLVTLGYECMCVPGTAGESCEINYDDCYSEPCLHGAQCTDTVQGFLCDCPDGTSGPDCSFNPDECASSPCINDAQCFNGFGTYICKCLPGYYGRECQYAHFRVSSSCVPNRCQNGATCSPGRDTFTCLCQERSNGMLCETAVQVRGGCVGNPCHNGSSCMDTDQGPVCTCSVGFTGPNCRWPLDNCELEPCQNGGTCEEGMYGSYLCTCASGYTGENCTQRVLACESSPCLNGGRCSDNLLDGSFSCQCHRNYTGLVCDIPILAPDLCDATPFPCSPSSNCTSGVAEVTCSCSVGFQGPNCSSVAPDPLPSMCASNPCHHGGTCTPGQLDTYTCACSRGFSGSSCDLNIDDCTLEPCLNGGTCEDGVGGFICICSEGITGEVCQVLCPEGKVGEFCEVPVRYCSTSSCSNGGSCVEVVGGFSCMCPIAYTGLLCELANDCTTTNCFNGGTCSELSGGAECACDTGFDGPNCKLLTTSFTGSSNQNSFRAFQPLQSQGRVSITLEFSTRAQAGLLLFSTQYQGGESRDMIALEVVGGKLRVSLALGSGAESSVVAGDSVYVSDGQWHQVSVEVKGRSFEVLLDHCLVLAEGLLALSQCKSSAVTPGNNSFLDTGLPLWIGGVPFTFPSTPHQPSSVGFAGCVRNVTINGASLDLEDYIEQQNSERGCGLIDDSCVSSECGAGTCVPMLGGFSCICPAQFAGDNCEKAAESLMFGGKGYTEYTLSPPAGIQRARRQTPPFLRSTISDQLSFRFRTEFASGILFQIGGGGLGSGDLSYVRLQGGSIAYHINLGSGEERVVLGDSSSHVDDAVWHYFEVERTALNLRLTLDNATLSRTLAGSHLYLDVGYAEFYAGGVPTPSGVGGGYTGCLEDIRVNWNILPTSGSNIFASVAFRGNSSVSFGCGLKGCFPDPCQGGTCIERGVRDFACSCEDGSTVVSGPCSEPERVTPYLFIIIIAAVMCGLVLLLILGIIVMVCWRRYTVRKFDLTQPNGGVSASPSDLILATRDCVVISNDAGGGEHDTTMTDEKWQQSVPIPRKEIPKASPSSATSSDESIVKSANKESPSQLQSSAKQSPQIRAQSPVISAFIDQRLESLRSEYPDLDTLKEFAEEGEGNSTTSFDSYCSYQAKEEAYTLARLRRAGPKFQVFANLLEVLAAEEDKEEDADSKIAHTGLTQTQTENGTQSQGGMDFGYF